MRRLLYPICFLRGHEWAWGQQSVPSRYLCRRCGSEMDEFMRALQDLIQAYRRPKDGDPV